MKEYLCGMLSALGYLLIYLLGGWDIALQCLVVAIALDYLSGLTRAFVTKTLSSKIGFQGIIKKTGLLLIVMVGTLVDRVTGNTGAVRTLIIYYFVANEGLSVLENLGQAGIPIPPSIKKALKALRKESK